MIHFKSIPILEAIRHFFYDEDNDVYYISGFDIWSRKYDYNFIEECWDYMYVNIIISKYVSKDITISYGENPYNDINIIEAHNIIIKRTKKINKLL